MSPRQSFQSKASPFLGTSAGKESSKNRDAKPWGVLFGMGLILQLQKDFFPLLKSSHSTEKICSSFCTWKTTEQRRENKLKGKPWVRDQGTISLFWSTFWWVRETGNVFRKTNTHSERGCNQWAGGKPIYLPVPGGGESKALDGDASPVSQEVQYMSQCKWV